MSEEIRTEEKTVLDTGWAQLDSLCTKGDFALEPMTEYFWTVSVRSDIGEEAVSEEQTGDVKKDAKKK